MPLLVIGTLPKTSFKSLTPGLDTSNYKSYGTLNIKHTWSWWLSREAATGGVLYKKMFLNISQIC